MGSERRASERETQAGGGRAERGTPPRMRTRTSERCHAHLRVQRGGEHSGAGMGRPRGVERLSAAYRSLGVVVVVSTSAS